MRQDQLGKLEWINEVKESKQKAWLKW
jgi:hypothetical protein